MRTKSTITHYKYSKSETNEKVPLFGKKIKAMYFININEAIKNFYN